MILLQNPLTTFPIRDSKPILTMSDLSPDNSSIFAEQELHWVSGPYLLSIPETLVNVRMSLIVAPFSSLLPHFLKSFSFFFFLTCIC